MEAMGFPDMFVRWVRACVTTPMFSVMLNGGLVGYFPGSRGLRQGDPISPYLFLLVMEVFSSLLQTCSIILRMGTLNSIQDCRSWGSPMLCLLMIYLFFCGAHEEFLRIIMNTLSFSGLQPNMMKSASYFSGVPTALKLSFLELMGISEGHLPVKYLGVPLISSRLTSTDCLVLKERILARIQSWSQKFLAYGGCAQLIQYVLCSIHTYWSSIFVQPQKIIKEIEGVLSAFLWSGIDMKHTGAKVSWAHLCVPKNGIKVPTSDIFGL